VIERDTTIRINTKTKEKLDNLEFARKNTSYNELIDKLIEEYLKKGGGK
jgi:predicted DNA-binding protein